MTERLTIALVEDSPADALIFQDMLEQAYPGVEVLSFPDAQAFISGLDLHVFDCVVTDNKLPDATGLELLQDLRRNPGSRFLPIVMLTGLGDESTAVKAIKLGASDYLSKQSADANSLRQAIDAAMQDSERAQQRAQVQQSLTKQALTDSLTGLFNRAAFDRRLADAVKVIDDEPQTCALVYIDLDGFKPINDTYGHQVGDHVLRCVATRLKDSVRGGDSVYRLGGDEFAVLLVPDPGKARLEDFAARVTERLGQPVDFDDDQAAVTVGASLGIARYPKHGPGAKQLVHAADQAMYRAKRGGLGICID